MPWPWEQNQNQGPTAAEELAEMQRLRALQAAGKDTSRASLQTAPKEQRQVAYFAERIDEKTGKPIPGSFELKWEDNPNYDPNEPKLTVYGSADSGYFRLDNNGNPITVQQPNADALIDKAVDRQIKEGDRNARARNEAAGIGYVTDADRARIENEARTQGLNEATLKQRIFEFGETQKLKDREEARLADVAKANIAKTGAETILTGAQTGRTEAETEQIRTQTQLLGGKTAADIKEAEARAAQATAATEKTRFDIEEARRKAGLPEIQQLGEGATYATMSPTGQITEHVRQGYVPKTLAEVQARVGQLSAAMNAKGAELQAKIGENYSRDQANRDYEDWHAKNIAPHQQALDAARQEALYAREKEAAATRTAALTAATQAGQGAVDAYRAAGLSRVGPGAAEAMNRTGAGSKYLGDVSAAFTQGKDPRDLYAEAVANALKDISPTAAQIAGAPQPNYAALNPSEALALKPWTPAAAGAPAGAAVGGGGPAPAAVAPPTPEQLQNRAMASFQTEAATAAAGTPFGTPIGNNPMLAAMQAAQAQAAPVPEPAATPAAPAPAAPPPRRVARMATVYTPPPTAFTPQAFTPEPAPYVPTVDESLARLGSGFEPRLGPNPIVYQPAPWTPPQPGYDPTMQWT